jgi:hypothetical protein
MNFIVTEYLQQVAAQRNRPQEGELLIVQRNYTATKTHRVNMGSVLLLFCCQYDEAHALYSTGLQPGVRENISHQQEPLEP